MVLYYVQEKLTKNSIMFSNNDLEHFNGSIIFEPFKKINHFYYRCDKKFHLNSIMEMYEKNISFGYMLVSGKRYILYKINKFGQNMEIIKLYDNSIKLQKRQKKGGQSAQRIGRIRDEKENNYVKKIVEKMKFIFIKMKIKGLVIGGPSNIKNKIIENDDVNKFFGNNILKVVTTPEIDDNTINYLYKESLDVTLEKEDEESLNLLNKIKLLIELADSKLIIGYNEAIENLKICMLETLLISKNIDENIKKNLYKYQQNSGCKIIEFNPNISPINGDIDIMGIKWY